MNNSDFKITDWLPTQKKEMKKRGWEELDVIIVSGDAYVDHPSFGHAVVSRYLESLGLKVGIIAQPNWQDDLRDFKKLGKPNLFFGVTAGCMDSMVNHYTANKRLRSDDAYTAGGKSGFRPDYPTIEYTKILKELFPDTPVFIGGIEASLRRVTHYDYYNNELMPSILKSSGADLLMYGMGEKPLRELVKLTQQGRSFDSLTDIPQTAILVNEGESIAPHKKWEDVELASHEESLADKRKFANNFMQIEIESNRYQSNKRFIQKVGSSKIVINPPFEPMTTKEIDYSFSLPYTRLPHPRYKKRGAIPAYEMIKNSINLHRGCFGGCAFCTISAHQGKFISSRSEKSIISEIEKLSRYENFDGVLTDLGGPSANMYRMEGIDLEICKKCSKASCIFPTHCSNLNSSHRPLIDIYKKVRGIKKIKRAFVNSGIRYDLFMMKKDSKELGYKEYFYDVVKNHVSGRLKVAPEHTSDSVLKVMRKPKFSMFKKLKDDFDRICKKENLRQEIIPYFISSHPVCKEEDMANLAHETEGLGYRLEQVQDFTPTPMTLATVMYYSGINPYTGEEVYVAKKREEKLSQRKFFFWYKSDNKKFIMEKFKEFNLLDKLKKLFR